MAHKRGGGADRGDAPGSTSLQLDFFRNQNEEILEELKRIEIDRMTPLEALEFLAEIREKLV